MKLFTSILLTFLLAATFLNAQTIQLPTPVGAILHNNSTVTPDGGFDQVHLYPNPSSDIVYLNVTFQQQEPVRLQLYNLLGQTVWSVNLDKTQRVDTTIPVQQLANGVYLLQITAGNTIEERKIVVAK
jgi:hypothetical protein